jgi:hypothetical protein
MILLISFYLNENFNTKLKWYDIASSSRAVVNSKIGQIHGSWDWCSLEQFYLVENENLISMWNARRVNVGVGAHNNLRRQRRECQLSHEPSHLASWEQTSAPPPLAKEPTRKWDQPPTEHWTPVSNFTAPSHSVRSANYPQCRKLPLDSETPCQH